MGECRSDGFGYVVCLMSVKWEYFVYHAIFWFGSDTYSEILRFYRFLYASRTVVVTCNRRLYLYIYITLLILFLMIMIVVNKR